MHFRRLREVQFSPENHVTKFQVRLRIERVILRIDSEETRALSRSRKYHKPLTFDKKTPSSEPALLILLMGLINKALQCIRLIQISINLNPDLQARQHPELDFCAAACQPHQLMVGNRWEEAMKTNAIRGANNAKQNLLADCLACYESHTDTKNIIRTPDAFKTHPFLEALNSRIQLNPTPYV